MRALRHHRQPRLGADVGDDGRAHPAERVVAPVVEVELTVRGRRLEVVRSPAWERPKARGTGTTTEQSSVRVREQVGSGWVPLAARLDALRDGIKAAAGI